MTSQFVSMTSTSNFFKFSLFILSGLVTGPSFMSISWLVLELWQFLFIKGWPKMQKSEIPPSEFCPISWDWDKLGITKLGQMFLIKFYWMLQKCQSYRVKPFLSYEEKTNLLKLLNTGHYHCCRSLNKCAASNML